jgi:translation initiation factor 5
MDSSKMLNIPSSIKDPNYRYKMPKIIASTQGSGGNVKTKLENLKEVAHALTVPSDYPLKFIGKELGSQTEIKNDVHLINGSHQAEKLQTLLDKFIEKYVLCPKCKLPEIRIFVKKGEIRSKCRACGTISKLDDKHKFANHIKNFPPAYDPDMDSKGPQVDDKGDKGAKSATGPSKTVIDKETKLKIKSTMEKISKLFDSANDIDDITSEIDTILKESNLEMQIMYFVLIHGIFDKNIYSSQLSQRIPIIKHILSKEEDTNHNEAVFHIITGLADLLCNRFKDLGKFVSSILYYLYDTDIITEDFWIKYAVKNSFNFISPLFSRENEQKFFDNAREFSHWIENAPYEDEIDKCYRGINEIKDEKKVEKILSEEINIDDI